MQLYNSKLPSNSNSSNQSNYISWLITNLKNRKKENNKNIRKSQINGKNFAKLFQKKKKNDNRAYEYYFNTDFLKRQLFVDKSSHHGCKH